MKKHLGFTLIEVLVIVGAISALTAIAYPTVDRGFEQVREAADVAAMQSADSLMTSAALSGKRVDGYPAGAFTEEQPLYYDGNGNLTTSLPAPYGKGTGKNGGKSWSACVDGSYDPGMDYTQSVVSCWYDSATRITHVHWVGSDGSSTVSRPQGTGKVEPTFPTFDPRPTEPGENPGTGGGTGGSVTPPEPVQGVHSHAYLTYEEWNLPWLKVPILAGHRYCYEGKLYLAVASSPLDSYAKLPPDKSSAFIPLGTPNTEKTAPDGDHPWVLYAKKNVVQNNGTHPAGSLCFSNDVESENYSEESNFSMALQTGDYFIDDNQTPWRIYMLRQDSDHAMAPTGVCHETFNNLWIEFTSECASADGFSCCVTVNDKDAFSLIADPTRFLAYIPQK